MLIEGKEVNNLFLGGNRFTKVSNLVGKQVQFNQEYTEGCHLEMGLNGNAVLMIPEGNPVFVKNWDYPVVTIYESLGKQIYAYIGGGSLGGWVPLNVLNY
ncbi:hypothetical protein [Lactobacillus melliventris]|uniref:Uncharacterized protein n=1 Tax=Lactobacillus melliventris TaxID=1218507 RepID=A0ABX5MZT4_9LACO|nr:hypothetical protein [Lactobacillus melliventris]PXY84375.1 hypothetical protein DK873_04270 [Lactobacillus melliventris]